MVLHPVALSGIFLFLADKSGREAPSSSKNLMDRDELHSFPSPSLSSWTALCSQHAASAHKSSITVQCLPAEWPLWRQSRCGEQKLFLPVVAEHSQNQDAISVEWDVFTVYTLYLCLMVRVLLYGFCILPHWFYVPLCLYYFSPSMIIQSNHNSFTALLTVQRVLLTTSTMFALNFYFAKGKLSFLFTKQ